MIPIKKFIPGIAWFFLVLILICLPGDDLPKAENWMSAIYFDKWVHMGLFSILAFLFMLPFCNRDVSDETKQIAILKVALATCIWGLTTELIQKFYIPSRDFDLLDWAADSLGIVFALFVCKWFYIK